MDPRGFTLDEKIIHLESMFNSITDLKNHYEKQKKNASDLAQLEFDALIRRIGRVS